MASGPSPVSHPGTNMDDALRLAGIVARRDPNDTESLWKYIRKLEQVLGVAAEPKKLFALLCDGTLEGDSLFYSCGDAFLPYTEGECQYSLLDKWQEVCYNGDDMSEYYHCVTEAWVVDEAVVEYCNQLEEPGCSDSISYVANTMRKSHAQDHTIKIIKFQEQCPCEGCQ